MPSFSNYTTLSVRTLGRMVRLGRLTNKMTTENLAERLGVTRKTVHRMETGDPTLAIGIVFEAASIVGVKLLSSDEKEMAALAERTDDRIAVLPQKVYPTRKQILDDF